MGRRDFGSIRRRNSGRWQARYRDPSGRLHARTFGTRSEAARYLAGVRAAQPWRVVRPDRWAADAGRVLSAVVDRPTGARPAVSSQDHCALPLAVGQARSAHSQESTIAPTITVRDSGLACAPHELGWPRGNCRREVLSVAAHHLQQRGVRARDRPQPVHDPRRGSGVESGAPHRHAPAGAGAGRRGRRDLAGAGNTGGVLLAAHRGAGSLDPQRHRPDSWDCDRSRLRLGCWRHPPRHNQ